MLHNWRIPGPAGVKAAKRGARDREPEPGAAVLWQEARPNRQGVRAGAPSSQGWTWRPCARRPVLLETVVARHRAARGAYTASSAPGWTSAHHPRGERAIESGSPDALVRTADRHCGAEARMAIRAHGHLRHRAKGSVPRSERSSGMLGLQAGPQGLPGGPVPIPHGGATRAWLDGAPSAERSEIGRC